MKGLFNRIDGTIWEELFLIVVVFIASLLGIFAWVWFSIKRILPALLIAAPLCAQVSLTAPVKFKYGQTAAGAGVMFVAGLANGTNEAISHHYGAFQRRFPNASPQFWNPAESWRNKYKNGTPENGPAFAGSTGALVWTTDGYHLTNTIRTAGLTTGCIVLIIGEKRPIWHYAVQIAAGMGAYYAGNYLTYNVLFK